MFRFAIYKTATLLVLIAGISAPATAGVISVEFGPGIIAVPGFNGGNTLDISLVVPTNALFLTGFDLTVEGDLDSNDEFFEVSLDSLSLGTVLNGIPGDDDFNFSSGTDIGLFDPVSSSVLLALDVTSIVDDGAIQLSFITSDEVDAPEAVNTPSVFPDLTGQFAAFGTLTFETADLEAVPEPGSLAIFGMLGLVAIGRRRTRRS